MEALTRSSFMIDIECIYVFMLTNKYVFINKFHLNQSRFCFVSCVKLQANLESSLKIITPSDRTYLPFSNSFPENFDWPHSPALFFPSRN